MFKAKRKFPMILFSLWCLFLLILFVLFLLDTWNLTYKSAAESSKNEAQILANSFDASLRRIAGLIDWIEFTVGLDRELIDIIQELEYLTRNFPEIIGFHLYTIDGNQVGSSSQYQCRSDEDPSLVNLTISDLTLSYSDTLICNETNRPILIMQRPIRKLENQRVGIVSATVDLLFYENLFSLIDVGSQGIMSFRRSDTSQLVVRWPNIPERMNNLAPNTPSQRAIDQGVTHGVITYLGGTDGVERIFAFQKLLHFPFYSLVGRETGEIFQSWRLISGIAVISFIVLIVSSGIFLVKLERSLYNKNNLIHELLHRTNNSIQLILSLVQLEQSAVSSSLVGQNSSTIHLDTLFSRIHCLGLIQQHITKDYSSVRLENWLHNLKQQLITTYNWDDLSVVLELVPPNLEVLLDYVQPIGLIITDLLMFRTEQDSVGSASIPKTKIKFEIDEQAHTLWLYFNDTTYNKLSDQREEFLAFICEYQLNCEFKPQSNPDFSLILTIPLLRYTNRVV